MLTVKAPRVPHVLHAALWMKTWISNMPLNCHTQISVSHEQNKIEALQPLLNNTKTNCFSYSHRSNMHEANWQQDQIAFFSVFLSPHHTHHQAQTTAQTHHNTTVQSDQAMWLHAGNVFSSFLSDWGTMGGAACAESGAPSGHENEVDFSPADQLCINVIHQADFTDVTSVAQRELAGPNTHIKPLLSIYRD